MKIKFNWKSMRTWNKLYQYIIRHSEKVEQKRNPLGIEESAREFHFDDSITTSISFICTKSKMGLQDEEEKRLAGETKWI